MPGFATQKLLRAQKFSRRCREHSPEMAAEVRLVVKTAARSQRKIADANFLRIALFKPSYATPNARMHARIRITFENYFVLKVYCREIHDRRGRKENLTRYATGRPATGFRNIYGVNCSKWRRP
jgi:hypothetical protein